MIGRGWNQEKGGLGRFPTAADIDAVVAERPVWLERVDGHAGWANSAAMRTAKITAATKAPEGGRIETANGPPSGMFVDAAQDLIAAVVPRPLARDSDRHVLPAKGRLTEQGVQDIHDTRNTIETWQAPRHARHHH